MTKKRDLITLTPEQRRNGVAMRARMEQMGTLAPSSFNAELSAPKTWILYVKDGRVAQSHQQVLMCELYGTQGAGDSRGEGMLHGMCPKCCETFIVREGNKSMSLDWLEFRRAPEWMQHAYLLHHMNDLGRPMGWRPPSDTKIPLVSSPERWMCDYCKSFAVRVSGGVAMDDHRGIGVIYAPQGSLIQSPTGTQAGGTTIEV